jgi:hypothetical protein
MQFQFHASRLAVYVVLRCKQRSLEHPTGKSVMLLGLVILVDTPRSPLSSSTYESTEVAQTLNLQQPFSFT